MEGLTHADRKGRPARASMTDTQQPTWIATRTRHTVVVPNSINMVSLLGPGDEHLALIEQAFDADIHVRGNRITLYGEPGEVALAERLLDELVTIIRTGQGVTGETVERVLHMLRAETTERPADVLSLNILSNRGRSIRPKTLNQKRYVDSIDKHTITFGIGPAGTGKTYLAMAKAVQALQSKNVNRIILTRPAVEAGERLGFLPGTLSEKIDPYLRPLYDALHDMIDPDSIPKLLAAGTIEVAPLAYMRGRTLNDAFIILDEAQNTTPEQMKMFLTRLGFGSKIVVTGDVTQIDLPGGGLKSGLKVVEGILDGVEDVVFNRLTSHDVVRHRWSAGSSRRTTSSTPRAASAGSRSDAVEHRGAQRVRARPRRQAAGRAQPVRDGPDARAPAGRAVHQGRRRGDHRRAQRSSGWRRTGRPTCSPSRWTSCGPAWSTRTPRRACSATWCSAPRSPSSRARPPATAPSAEIELLTVHGILHLLGYDHAEPEEHKEMFGLQDELLAAWRQS